MKSLLPLSFLIVSGALTAQVKIKTAVDTSLYIGIDNPVNIHSTTIPADQLKLRTGNGTLSGKDGHYIIHCSTAGKDILLEVLFKNKVVASKRINVNRISDPVAYPLGESLFTDSLITRKQLATLTSLIVKLNYPLANFSVVSFTVEIIRDGKSTGSLQGSGRNLSPDMKTFLNYASPGDVIIFDAISVLCPDSGKRFVPPVKLRII